MPPRRRTSPFAGSPAADDDMVLLVTEAARTKLIELRDEEPEGDRLGVRIEIVSDEGQDFTYDLSFQIITKADLSDVVRNHGGLRVIVPARDATNLEGATLDYEARRAGAAQPEPTQAHAARHADHRRRAGPARCAAVIDGEINPALDAHGGFVTFIGHDGDGKAYLTMGGGCHGCSMSRMTMLQGVQADHPRACAGDRKVIDATDHADRREPLLQLSRAQRMVFV